MTNKNRCVTELYKNETLLPFACSSKLQLMEWRFDSAWKFGFGGDFTSDERAVNGPGSVERVQKGDQKAFNLLVVRYQHKWRVWFPAMCRWVMFPMWYKSFY